MYRGHLKSPIEAPTAKKFCTSELCLLSPMLLQFQVKAETVRALVTAVNEAIAELEPWPLPGEPISNSS